MKGGRSWVVMVVAAAAVVVGVLEARLVSAGPSAAECKEEKRLGINACKPVVYGKDPSPACCERVRVSHIECVCPVITPKLAALIDVNRAVRLIEGCGRKVPRHYKCGSEVWWKIMYMRGGRKMKMGRWMMVMMVMVVMVVVVGGMREEVKTESAAASEIMINGEECKEERGVGIKECKPVVFGVDPSPACCGRVRVTHTECVCPLITPKLAALIDVDKLARLIQGCGRILPRHFKCGALTFP